MSTSLRRASLARAAEAALLPFTAICLAAGAAAHVLGQPSVGDSLWILATVVSAGRLAVGIAVDLIAGSTGVDIVALLAMAGSVALGEYLAGAVIAVMYATGQALERFAHGRAERELRALLSRAPGIAHRYEADGFVDCPAESVVAGDRLLIKPGEVVPVDGIVVAGPAALDESALTGESRIVVRDLDDRVASGVVNAGAVFDIRAAAAADASTYAGIVRLVQIAQTQKSPFVRIADRYAGVFLVVSLGLAGVAWVMSGDPVRALAVLVVATPCPLLLAAPIAIVAGISRSARRGVIVKGGGALEALGQARVLLMDKTGTLTTGRPHLERVAVRPGDDPDVILGLAASLDQLSPHVLALAIVHAARERSLAMELPTDVVEQAGLGIRGRVGTRTVALGSREWIGRGSSVPVWARTTIERVELEGSMAILVEVDGQLTGILVMEDPIRSETPRALRLFRRAGIQRIIMVTGDHPAVAESVGAAIGVDGVLAERTPIEKVEAVKAERINTPGGTVMIGDGINDAPALAAADVGVAMGARGATASSEAADVVITVDRLDRLAEAITIARRSRHIAVQSVVVGVALSGIAMVAAALGLLAPVEGALLQEAIDVIVIVNALRALTGGGPGAVQLAGWNALRADLEIEHRQLLPLVAAVGRMADTCDELAPGEAAVALIALAEDLDDRLLRHELLEETTVYPALAAAIGGQDPMAVMSGSHREIFHLIRLLRRNTTRLDEAGPDRTQMRDIRRILYSLHAILGLHFAQEEELYAAVTDPRPTELAVA
ncbi:MAG: heavy metal translocating P-type ATPase [Candidatus Limnocylindrales bacterium]